MSGARQINLRSDKGEIFSYYHCDNCLIGSGAMGEVYKGWNVNTGQDVAIKKIYPRHAENRYIRDRARHEASLSIDHPHLIKMLGYCETDRSQGSVYIISEYVNGTTIDRFVRSLDAPHRVDIVCRMMCSVLDALSCLHSQHPPVWHRDVKPSNMMVENGKNVRLMDLGIATSDGISLGTLEGRGFGTYPYAPPEQITGQKSLVNGTSDIYSLGIAFYELLTGINPFAGGSDVDILEKQLKMTLPYHASIPKPLFKILLKATDKKQADRYSTAAAFKDAVLKYMEPDHVRRSFSPELIIGLSIAGVILIFFIILAIL